MAAIAMDGRSWLLLLLPCPCVHKVKHTHMNTLYTSMVIYLSATGATYIYTPN